LTDMSTLKTPEPRVLLVSGSPRKNGNTDTVLAAMANRLSQRDIPTQTVRLCDLTINPCTGCEACRRAGTCTRFNDDMNALYPVIEGSRGLVLGSPTYNYNITPETKAFIDRLYPYFDFTEPRPGPYTARLAGQGRKMVTLAICEQNEASEMGVTIPAISSPMKVVGYEIVAELPVTGHFPRGSVASDTAVLAQAQATADLLADALVSTNAL